MNEQDPPPTQIELEGPDGVAIRQLIPEDAQGYFDLIDYDRTHLSQFGDSTAEKYQSVEDVLESIVNPSNPEKKRFGIWVDGVMVGTNNLTPLADGRVESGSWIGAKHKGHHYAAKARQLLVDIAFKHLGYQEVVSKIKVGNEVSRKSVEKGGFRFVEEKDGEWFYTLKSGDVGKRLV